ncbi:glycosyltransferase [Vibrio mexicanus]|uniref:glycosyltransferase n=1 Tax=Vibrio mexicanus TaxID=1004326 RepID=UPI00063C0CB4|nr:glycosyltransferase [Vibrio mexicanus]
MSQGTDFFDIDISIIIPTYNRKELLMQTLSSIDRCKKEGIKLEVIIVDDGSSDGSEETIKKQEYNFNYHYHYHEDKGYRVSLSRNVGAKLSRGRILAFVDSGMIVGSNFLKAHKKLHDESQNLAVIGYMYAIEQNLSKSSREKLSQLYLKQNVDEFCNSIVNSHEFSDIREPVFEASSDTLTRLPYPWAIFWTGNVSIKRELYNKTQGFDEKYTSWGSKMSTLVTLCTD